VASVAGDEVAFLVEDLKLRCESAYVTSGPNDLMASSILVDQPGDVGIARRSVENPDERESGAQARLRNWQANLARFERVQISRC
jgi:uridine kinase